MSNPSTYSLLELNQYIRRVISLNFDEPLWIECEIGQASQSRGHFYLDLIQKEGEAIVAQCQGALWANVYFFLKRKSPIPPEEILKQGMSVKLKVNVDYHERYGLKLIIEDIDSSFTIGVLEVQRQAILKEIKDRPHSEECVYSFALGGSATGCHQFSKSCRLERFRQTY